MKKITIYKACNINLIWNTQNASIKRKEFVKASSYKYLKKSPPKIRCQLINYLNNDGIKVMSESIFNVLFNEAPLTQNQKRRIKKQYSKDKNILKEISMKKSSFKKRRKLLKQSGGFLGTLLGKKCLTTFKYNLQNFTNICILR